MWQVLTTIEGATPEQIDLGNFAEYKLREYSKKKKTYTVIIAICLVITKVCVRVT